MPGSRKLRRAGAALATSCLAGAAALFSVFAFAPYPDEPPVAHTGGFGEPTCHRCHFDKPLSPPGGSLALSGIGDSYQPGRVYVLTVTVTHPDLRRAGFQLACRFAEGERAGQQAGVLRAHNEKVAVRSSDSEVHYAQHTEAGSRPPEPGWASWTVEWIAPSDAGAGPVALHLAANAANGDASEFGDRVYQIERLLPRSP